MTQHTPGPRPKIPDSAYLECGCVVICPLHAAAPEMLAFLRDYADVSQTSKRLSMVDKARALLAKIEGKE